MGYDPAECLKNLNSKGLGPACQNLITPFHCDDVTGLDPGYHQTCFTAGIFYFPIICLVCRNTKTNQYVYFPSATFFTDCGNLHAKDPAWQAAQCYCCCSCLASDTLIAVPSGEVPIDSIQRGEEVLAASLSAGGSRITWSTAKVRFSMGTSREGFQPMMVYIVFGEGAGRELICNTDQPFLLADGKFTTGGKLRPGQQLVDRDGKPLPVQLVSIGQYDGGVHHIATDEPWTGSPNGHLLLAAGAVAGDFALQSGFSDLPAELKEPNYDQLPLIGTADFDATAHAQHMTRADAVFEFVPSGKAAPGTLIRPTTSGVFRTYRKVRDTPPGAQMFLTRDQADDIMTKGVQAPLSNPIPLTLFNTVKAQLSGFFPDIHFYYDAIDVSPNLYAFEAYGQKIVQVNGGLARMQGFNYEGLFTAMAHGVGCFNAGVPKNAAGYSAVGQADAYAFGAAARLNWVGDPFLTYVLEAMAQWKALFALVKPEHAHGNPKDPLNDPGLACRIKAIESATAGGGLPECAGGDPLPRISLERAVARSTEAVTLTLSLAVNNETGSDAANYTLDPPAPVTGAKLDASTGFVIHLEVMLKPDTDYKVTVHNLVSILGTGLDPAHVTVSFKTPAA
ncbi:MAG TPA: hypothetical protein VMH81_17825 [Bryobacteraceae bacterium]|nr:hypothetical protein [Bryobacteraceae bacterium]